MSKNENKTIETETKKTQADKRATLGKIAVGSSVLWIKPVVNSIVLPAHAQMSPPQTSLTDPCTLEIIDGMSPWTYSVRINGQIEGVGNDGVTVNIDVSAGGQNFSTTAVSDGTGAYGPIDLGEFDTCLDIDDPVATITSMSFSGSAMCTAAHGKICLDAQFVSPCSAILLFGPPSSLTTYSVRVSGQITGMDNAGRSIDIEVTTGGQTFSSTVVTNGSGAYGPVDYGLFDTLTDSSNPVVTATSTEFSGSAICTLNHGK